jgi:hypothetical protein
VLLPGPRSRGAIAAGLGLLGVAAVGLTIGLWDVPTEAGSGAGFLRWGIALVGASTVVFGVAAVVLSGRRAVQAYGATVIGSGLLLGLTVGWTIALASVAIQLVTVFRLLGIEEPRPDTEPPSPNEPMLACFAGTLFAGTLLLGLEAWSPPTTTRAEQLAATEGASTSPLVMGGALLLVGLAFLGMIDEPNDGGDVAGDE